MSDDKRLPDDLDDLERRLKTLHASAGGENERESPRNHPIGTMLWVAFHVVSELVGGVVCGLAIGWGIDGFFGTRPVFIAVFLVLGCVAAVLNVVRYLQRHDEALRQKEEIKR